MGAGTMNESCTCEWAEYVEFHCQIVAFEKRGVEGVVWLLDTLAAHAEEEPSAAHPLAWTELVRCVAEHNWRNPVAAARLAVEVESLFRARALTAVERPPSSLR
jgi:hypothetical protein